MIRAALMLLLLATAAWAQEYPAFYRVDGVAQDDVLNIRAAPSIQSPVIGALTPDAVGIEVIRTQEGWGQINISERAGWVALRFMQRESGQTPATLLERLSCSGTEPFWSAKFLGEALEFEALGAVPLSFANRQTAVSLSRPDKFGASWVRVEAQAGGDRADAVVTRALCSDGMSDRVYGLSIDLLLWPDASAARLYSGCCNLR